MTDENETGTYALDSVETVEFELDVTEVKDTIDETITVGSLDDSVDCDTIQFGTSVTPISSYKNNGRLTFIDDSGDAYEPDGFKVTDEDTGAMRVSIPDQFFPPELGGMSPKTMHRWEVVITHDGETKTGYIIEAEHDYNKNKFTLSVDP